MKRFFSFLFIALLVFVFVGCDKTPKEVKLEVDVNDKTVEIVVGQTKTITVEVTEGFELEWTTSNPEVATVEDGVVTAVAAGTAEITVKVKDREEKETISVNVVLPHPAEVILTGEVKQIIGTTQTLTVEVKPELADQTIEWESSNPEVATVNNEGKVTALSVGTTTITAKSTVDNVKATITIEVVLPEPISITINGPTELDVGSSVKLSVVVAPALANQGVNWSVDNEELATISKDGTLTALKAGKVKVIATSVAKNTITAEHEVTLILLEPTSVTITGPSEIYLGKEATIKFTAKVNPSGVDQTVTWKVSDDTLATIDANGVLTPHAVGTVKITATSTKETVFAEVTLEIKEFLPTDVVINGKNKVLVGVTEQYTAIVSPEGISQEVIWQVDNDALATIDEDGLLTPLVEGKVVITVRSVLLDTVTATIEVEIVDAKEAAELMEVAKGYTPYFPGGDVFAFLDLHGWGGYTLEFGNKQLLFYGEKAFISLRAMEAGETVLPWQVVQPYTTGDEPLVNHGVRKEGAVGAIVNEVVAPTGVIYHNPNASAVVVKSKELYGYQGSAWGHGMYGVILVNNEGEIITNFASTDLDIGIEIEIPAGGYVITMFQGDRQIVAGLDKTTSETRGAYSFAKNPEFAVGKTIKITNHKNS